MNANNPKNSIPTMLDYGEKLFVKKLLSKLHPDKRLVDGFGHDASVIKLDNNNIDLIFKIDRSSKPVAISKGWSDMRAWGRLAVTANCSDILAGGGHPLAFMLAICIPPSWRVSDVEDIVLGCEEECVKRGIVFAGGDTKESEVPQVIGSAIGTVATGHSLRRDRAKPGHKLVVAGPVGGFMGAYLQLENIQNAPTPKRDAWIRYISQPVARWSEAGCINNLCLASASMDTSDGIFDALSTMTMGQIGLVLDMNKIPFHPFAVECAQQLNVPLYNLIMGGGDWNIMYAVDEAHIQTLKEQDPELELHVIGEFVEEREIIAFDDSSRYSVNGPINEQFRSRIEDMSSFMEGIINAEYFKKIR
jgi:thiamine-monophosphate kinase